MLGLTIALLQVNQTRRSSPSRSRRRRRQARVHRECDAARSYPVAVRPRLIAPLLRKGSPFYGSAIAAFLYQRVDVLVLGSLVGVAAAGEYVAAYRILDGVLLLPAAVVAAFLPSWAARRTAKGAVGRGGGMVVLMLVCIGVLPPLSSCWLGSSSSICCTETRTPHPLILAVLALSVPFFYADIALVWLAYVQGHENGLPLSGLSPSSRTSPSTSSSSGSSEASAPRSATVVTEAAISAGYAFTLGIHRREHRPRALELLATAGAYSFALLALVMLCAFGGVPRALTCLAVGGLGLALLTMVYRRAASRVGPVGQTTNRSLDRVEPGRPGVLMRERSALPARRG